LGHIQRGGIPTATDRVLATKLGGFAIDCIEKGEHLVMVGEVQNELVATPLEKTWSLHKPLDPYLLKISRMLES
jgi:6-phosphofructokinase 1